MELAPNAEQKELQDGARRFLEKQISRERLEAWDRTEPGYDERFWADVTALGWLGFAVPEATGGAGASLLDTALLMEECGRALAPSALHAVIVGARALAAAGGPQAEGLLRGIAAGRQQVTLAAYEADGSRSIPAFRTCLQGGRLSGEKWFVRQGVTADALIVVARDAEMPALYLVPAGARGVSRRALETFGGDRQSVVRFEGVEPGACLARGERVRQLLARVDREAAALALAEMVGGFSAVVDMTVAYVKERVQFGQPLGKFQGVQFLCADLATLQAGTRHAAFQAIWRLSEGLDAERELAIARAWCGRACKQATLQAHQLHGGAGYVVEHPLRRHSERAQACALAYAREDESLARLASLLLDDDPGRRSFD